MKMKKTMTIAASALAASLSVNNANAFPMPVEGPQPVYETRVICFDAYGPEGAKTVYAPVCDDADNNYSNNRPLMENGCSEGQVAIKETRNVTEGEKFKIKVKKCEVVDDNEIQPVQL